MTNPTTDLVMNPLNKGKEFTLQNVHFSVLSKQYQKLYESGIFSDVKIHNKANGKLYNLHKFVICNASTYFSNIFESSFKEAHQKTVEIYIDDPNSNLDIIFEYLYSGKIEIDIDKILPVRKIARQLYCFDLIEVIGEKLVALLDYKNCFDMFQKACDYYDDEVLTFIMDYITFNFSLVHEHAKADLKKFLPNLPLDMFLTFLSQPGLLKNMTVKTTNLLSELGLERIKSNDPKVFFRVLKVFRESNILDSEHAFMIYQMHSNNSNKQEFLSEFQIDDESSNVHKNTKKESPTDQNKESHKESSVTDKIDKGVTEEIETVEIEKYENLDKIERYLLKIMAQNFTRMEKLKDQVTKFLPYDHFLYLISHDEFSMSSESLILGLVLQYFEDHPNLGAMERQKLVSKVPFYQFTFKELNKVKMKFPEDLPKSSFINNLYQRIFRLESSTTQISGSKKTRFIYSGQDFVGNGILYWLGTNYGMEKYQNPYLRGLVKITTSIPLETVTMSLGNIVSHEKKPVNLNKGADPSITFHFPTIAISPTMYSLRHTNRTKEAMVNWKLFGKDNHYDNWVLLDERKNENSLDKSYSTKTFKIRKACNSYRYFKLAMIGNNSSGSQYMSCAGFELFGKIEKLQMGDNFDF